MKENNRIHWLDYLKAFGIFLVVYGHSGSVDWGIGKWIYSFHMPLFFLVSGYLISEESLSLSFLSLVKKTLYSLVPPYLFFSIIGYAFWLFVGRNFGEDSTLDLPFYYPILATFYGTGSPEFFHMVPVVLWFFPCLIVSQIIVYSYIVRAKESYSLLISISLFVIGLLFNRSITLPFELDTAFVAQFFILLGFIGRRKKITKYLNGRYAWLGFVLLFGLGTVAAFLNDGIDMRTSKYSNPFYFLLSSLSLSIAFVILFQRFTPSKIIQLISKNTVIIFPLHPIVFTLFTGVYVYILQLSIAFKENAYVGIFASILITLLLAFSSPLVRFINPWVYGIKPNKTVTKN